MRISRNSISTSCQERFTAPFLAMMSTSWLGTIWWRYLRKHSLRSRFTRLRTTAFPTFELTVTPSRASPRSFGLVMIKKWGPWIFFPQRDRLKNSGRFLRRACLGKFALPPDNILRVYVRARFGGTLTVNLFRPLALRLFNTLRPPGVSIRMRKPWVLLRRTLLG